MSNQESPNSSNLTSELKSEASGSHWIFELKKEKLLKLLIVNEELGSRLSDLLLSQLQIGISNDSIHAQMVLEEVRALEGRCWSRTRVEAPFRGESLLGLHKKHFFQSGFIGRNLQNEWKLQSKKSKKFHQMLQTILKNGRDPLEMSHQIANQFVNALSNREQRQTLDGEWIVFAKWAGKNYYLTLADHKEDDKIIRNRILTSCVRQFPFISEILGTRSDRTE